MNSPENNQYTPDDDSRAEIDSAQVLKDALLPFLPDTTITRTGNEIIINTGGVTAEDKPES